MYWWAASSSAPATAHGRGHGHGHGHDGLPVGFNGPGGQVQVHCIHSCPPDWPRVTWVPFLFFICNFYLRHRPRSLSEVTDELRQRAKAFQCTSLSAWASSWAENAGHSIAGVRRTKMSTSGTHNLAAAKGLKAQQDGSGGVRVSWQYGTVDLSRQVRTVVLTPCVALRCVA